MTNEQKQAIIEKLARQKRNLEYVSRMHRENRKKGLKEIEMMYYEEEEKELAKYEGMLAIAMLAGVTHKDISFLY